MELRLYSFINVYLSGIQAGIQTGHMAVDLVSKYRNGCDAGKNHTSSVAWDWADNYKTFIVLNGGAHVQIKERKEFFETNLSLVEDQIGHPLPWCHFNEDDMSLNGLLTCVGVVLPETIFNAVDYRRAMNTVPDAREFSAKYDLNQRDGAYFVLKTDEAGEVFVADHYPTDSPAAQLISDVKSCRLFGA